MNTPTSTDMRQHILDTAQVIIAGRGFTAVGLNEILQAANVPKGSFYHYFASKEAFGEALLDSYFSAYMAQLEVLLSRPGVSAAQRLLDYWLNWLETQSTCDPKGKCLAVKLAAEVSDLSEPMRVVLRDGTERVIARLTNAVSDAVEDGSLPESTDARGLAAMLYQLWLGASLRAKITRDRVPLEAAFETSLLLLSPASGR
ncbi:TPA: TetR/AcrR family transcriptional regulator [Pseudomonas aeruginosa]|uniref:TetR/AcrR family transcriptional regulator n=1 Tax=Pseudomonas citronellolis TaxID=53408 RepID=UPI001A1845CC|nr:TetR/AcrR family transcriptional regulator [Pseudomonas citronellolis]MBH3547443.1 TetR/AcrR family transcriptional regulator [Pseudomonas aeruginosa]UUC47469.1 TetR/AcrR family transcriptional regulator [Pseudomonas citronellolis]HBN9703295.1 TetR/AcrR family transcriptional regulator [Pseudomonas aeruginosa]HBN9721843.1 TetR/AcrR family transcriptional regulator [Pseudomonas aeruginosa]HBN9767922.1 TetR/AcrR family transcriptional regulator [Pseudomonas aeruginosa]